MILNLDFNYDSEYHYLPELQCSSKDSEESSQGACAAVEESMHICCSTLVIYKCVVIIYVDLGYKRHFAIIEFEKPVYCAEKSVVIGSRLDTDAYILHLCLCVLVLCNVLLWVVDTYVVLVCTNFMLVVRKIHHIIGNMRHYLS